MTYPSGTPGTPTPKDLTPVLGYDPNYTVGFGPVTPEEYALDFANTYLNRYLSGNLGDTGVGTVWDASLWSGALPSPEIRGVPGTSAGIAGAADWNTFYQQGLRLAQADPDQLAAMGLPAPPQQLAGGGYPKAPLSDADKGLIIEGQYKDKLGDAALINAQANLASAEKPSVAAGIRAAADIQVAQIRAAVDREAIAVQREAERGLNRRFDLQIAEDRRQFNEDLAFRREVLEQQKVEFRTGVVVDLLDRAVELSRAPVDWIAHQFYMANLGAPLTAAGIVSSAAVFGAFPPSGPSAAGALIGGPAAMDGDTALATALGVQAGFVPVSQAVALLPGTGFGGTYPEGTAQSTIVAIANEVTGGDVQALDQAVEQARATEVAPSVVQNPVMDAAVTGMTAAEAQLAVPTSPATAPPSIPTSGTTAPAVASTATAAPLAVPGSDSALPGEAVNTGGEANAGVYVGPAAQSPQQGQISPLGTVYAGSGAQNPQGEALLQIIATESGIPLEQLRSVLDPALLAGGYSKETIMNSPALRAIREGIRPGEVRTAPVAGQGPTIGAFGIPLGIRSGQDLYAPTFLKAGEVNQGLMAGAIQAAGLNANDTFRQSLLASPVTNIQTGSFGRRAFG